MDFKRAVGMGQGTYLCRLIQVQIVHDVNELLQALGEARVKPPLLPHCRHRLTWGGGDRAVTYRKQTVPLVTGRVPIDPLSVSMGFTKCQIKHDRNCISL